MEIGSAMTFVSSGGWDGQRVLAAKLATMAELGQRWRAAVLAFHGELR